MRIDFVEIQNFRKLRSVRIDFDAKATLCVGANNSGKTSAMLALGHFLVDPARFTTHDFTLSNWKSLNECGRIWDGMTPWQLDHPLSDRFWHDALPSLDLWLDVPNNQAHLVQPLLPSLDWTGGKLGVRIRYEPKKVEELAADYLAARAEIRATMDAAASSGQTRNVALWPESLRTFLDRRLERHFTVRFYLLDAAACVQPSHGIATPQMLPTASEPLPVDPLKGLIRIDEIPAQRGLGESSSPSSNEDSGEGLSNRGQRRLSEQLRSYYSRHLDPSKYPNHADLAALEAIESAQKLYDEKLKDGFAASLTELQSLNYPGVTDPRLRITTRLRPSDGLNHRAAVQYDVGNDGTLGPDSGLCLPEDHNGLGYQNLILMVFKLMSFRDAWMRVGKYGQSIQDSQVPPLHLVLIEEPEAYLHAQVQQVFVRKAYDVLRNHATLRSPAEPGKGLLDSPAHVTQLVVSTHSNHIAHECDFASLRYFRRQPADATTKMPTAAVINLCTVFGTDDETRRFVRRYLRATHCDLFFADAAILVEGTAERLLLPHFIANHHSRLHCCYITLLEVNGSHAHRLRPLIETLGLLSLIVADLDSGEATGKHKVVAPKRGQGQVTRNTTVAKWHPEKNQVDELLDLSVDAKVKNYPEIPQFSVRVAYQCPVSVPLTEGASPSEILTRTFEEALIVENLSVFKGLPAEQNIAGVTAESVNATDPVQLSTQLFDVVNGLDKGAFALDVLWHKDPIALKVPQYIEEGLAWLESQLKARHNEAQPPANVPTSVQVAAE
jgi:predicted ATP-dependent endonuclease of OLD family